VLASPARRACELLRWVKIIDLLVDVDEMTDMSQHFSPLQTGEPASCWCSDAAALPRFVVGFDTSEVPIDARRRGHRR
jgi:hypothetical protein